VNEQEDQRGDEEKEWNGVDEPADEEARHAPELI
jgi:hypothetical protein